MAASPPAMPQPANPKQIEPGDPETLSFTELCRSALRDLRTYLRQRLRNPHDAEDLAQEALLRMWRGRATDLIESPRAYLFRVAGNLVTDRLRERQRWNWVAETEAPEQRNDLSPERTVTAREELDRVEEAIGRLPAAMRRAFELRMQGHSHADIAKLMDISKSMVEKHIAEALLRLDRARSALRPRQQRTLTDTTTAADATSQD